MTFLRVGIRLGRRRAVTGMAVFAALFCGLGSCIMQELAHSQRGSLSDQVAAAARAPAVDPAGVDRFARQTDALGARARALQSAGGAIRWAQSWLLTFAGLATVLVAIAVTTAADVEARRLLAGWHPSSGSRRSLLVTGAASLTAAVTVAGGALLGSALAALAGARTWPLGGEPAQAAVAGIGTVASRNPSAGWLVAWIGVVGAAILASWFAGRTLPAILAGSGFLVGVAALAELLPAWFPGAALPAATGMWFHHRGEVSHVWTWPYTPLEHGGPSVDWTAIAPSDPGAAALLGAALTLFALLVALPWALRRRLA